MISMRWRVWSLLGLSLFLIAPVASFAQLENAPLAGDELSRLLDKGRSLEGERRWAEAATYYEEAFRNHPQQQVLRDRLTIARTHCDLERRYSDVTFTNAVDRMNAKQASDLYDEVLLKIQTHHYQQPDWDVIYRRGLLHLDTAVSDNAFLNRHLKGAETTQITAFRKELAELSAGRKVTDRALARDYSLIVSKLASDRLSIPATATMLEFVCGATSSLDEYSGFLTEGQVEEVFSQIEGNFVGLGVELKADAGTLLIVNTISGGPASRGGLKVGDRITAVDGKTTQEVSTDTAADMLRGEEGTVVAVTVVSATGTQRTLRLVRQRVEVPSVEDAKMLDRANGIAYFKLTSFQKTTGRDVDAALWKLHGEGMRTLIMDLRGNPGGLLKAAVDVADKFVNEGLIVATRGRSPREDFDHRGQTAGTWRVPVVLLIDRDSASASEILAGAIRDHRRGVVVGERSYGKGSVQGIFPLSVSAGVRLTTAQWFTPAGHAISGQGITPDVVVRSAAKPANEQNALNAAIALQNDAILKAGLEAAKNQLAKRPTISAQMSKN